MQVQFVLTSTADDAFPSNGGEQGAGTRKEGGESVRKARKGGREAGLPRWKKPENRKKLHKNVVLTLQCQDESCKCGH